MPTHVGHGGGTGFEGATPRRRVAFTPNRLTTPLRDNADPLLLHLALRAEQGRCLTFAQ